MNNQTLEYNEKDLDKWVTEIINWHFSEETGSPYWLEKKRTLYFNPLSDIKTYNDLRKFGLFDDTELKNVSVKNLIPKGVLNKANNRISIFETGGTLGVPKRIIDYSYRQEVTKWLSQTLNLHRFPMQGNWLHLGPAGPHVVGQTTKELAWSRNGLCYYVDIDVRWVKKCVKMGNQELLNDYVDHVIEQALIILETQDIDFIFTTPKLLLNLCEKTDISNIKGICCGGTHVTPDLHRLLRQEIIPGVPLCVVYGNTLMGVAPQEPFNLNRNWDLHHYSFNPYFMLKVVSPDDPKQEVDYGEVGRVQITTLTKDYFIPNLLERDEAMRVPGNSYCSWDGVANVKPFTEIEQATIEGVY